MHHDVALYMIFRVDREYDTTYGTHSDSVSFRGVREGLSDLFTDPSKSDDLYTRKDGVICADTHRDESHEIRYLAVPAPTELGTGPEFAVELFESCH